MSIPQIIQITKVKNGGITLKKESKNHIGLGKDTQVHISIEDEIRVSSGGEGEKVELEKGKKLVLPKKVLDTIGVTDDDLIGLVEREGSLAIKKLEYGAENNPETGIIDQETTHSITRLLKGRLQPDTEIEQLRLRNIELGLKKDPLEYFSDKESIYALQARVLKEASSTSDEASRDRLIQEIKGTQLETGSWEESPMVTARMLRDLAVLGLSKEDPEVKKGVDWLLARPESPHNNGMFFLNDKLVQTQVELIEERNEIKKGSRPRFRKLLGRENKELIEGDQMVKLACGPRIMWPNSMVLDTLLDLGYEDEERVQRLLGFLKRAHWCECLYQHGDSDFRRPWSNLTDDEICKLEEDFINQYKLLGLFSLDELPTMDMSKRMGIRLQRKTMEHKETHDEYTLERFAHVQGCELMTMRALQHTTDPTLRRLIDAYLWRLASVQRDDGLFWNYERGGKYQNNMFYDNQIGYLEFFARFDHPASHIAIHRALPALIDYQNSDGSWGDEKPEIATLAVLRILKRIGFN